MFRRVVAARPSARCGVGRLGGRPVRPGVGPAGRGVRGDERRPRRVHPRRPAPRREPATATRGRRRFGRRGRGRRGRSVRLPDGECDRPAALSGGTPARQRSPPQSVRPATPSGAAPVAAPAPPQRGTVDRAGVLRGGQVSPRPMPSRRGTRSPTSAARRCLTIAPVGSSMLTPPPSPEPSRWSGPGCSLRAIPTSTSPTGARGARPRIGAAPSGRPATCGPAPCCSTASSLGTWRRRQRKVTITMWHPPTAAAREAIEAEAVGLPIEGGRPSVVWN